MTTSDTVEPLPSSSVPTQTDLGLRILTVDYSRPRADVLREGNYQSDLARFTVEDFPIGTQESGVVDFEFDYLQPESSCTSDRGLQAIALRDTQNPWQAAGTEHLLAFGAKYPNEMNSTSPIVGLGVVGTIKGVRFILGLINLIRPGPWREGNLWGLDAIKSLERHLAPAPWCSIWQPDARFLIVRRVKR
jgi:hypothetical protein